MPRQLTAASLIAGITLRRRLRNRSFLVQAVLGPLLLATIISLAFGATGLTVQVTVSFSAR